MGQPILVFDKCCCGIPLRRASYIVAGVSLFLELIGAIAGIYMGVVQKREEGWINLAIEIVNVALAAFLIYGIKVTRQDLVFLWVWGSLMMMFLSLVVGIIMVVYAESIIGSVIMICMLSVQAYFLLVVRSYAHAMGDPAIIAAPGA